jgi:hypothetical protein
MPRHQPWKGGALMGEAKRKAQRQAEHTWAKGALKVVANDVECFDWSGTRQDAIKLQKRYLDVVNGLGINATSYARRAAGYLMVFGAPKAGQPRLCPDGFGEPWQSADVELNRAATLWLAFHEHVPNTGQRVEDIFVGKELFVMFIGDREELLAETEREQRGQPFSGEQFQMAVGVANENYRLDPDDAVCMNEGDLIVMAKGKCPDGLGDGSIYVPRIPLDAAEADAMLHTLTILTDATQPVADPKDALRTYAGYTEAELMRGKPGVRVR